MDFVFSGEVPEKVELQYRFDNSETCKSLTVAPGEKLIVKVPDFQLWSPESPSLHTLTFICNGKKLKETFGIRSFAVSGKKILLNGKELFLKGFNRHNSCEVSGAAVPAEIMRLDLQHLKDMGCNFVRGADYKQSRTFLELCDRMGILVWEESYGWQYGKKEFEDPEFCQLLLEQTKPVQLQSFHNKIIET